MIRTCGTPLLNLKDIEEECESAKKLELETFKGSIQLNQNDDDNLLDDQVEIDDFASLSSNKDNSDE